MVTMKIPHRSSDKPLSNREVVRQLVPTLLKMRGRSFTTGGTLAELLQVHQIAIKGRDLSRYLREFQDEKVGRGENIGRKTESPAAEMCPVE